MRSPQPPYPVGGMALFLSIFPMTSSSSAHSCRLVTQPLLAFFPSQRFSHFQMDPSTPTHSMPASGGREKETEGLRQSAVITQPGKGLSWELNLNPAVSLTEAQCAF